MSQPTPEPVLDERGRIDAATSVEAIIAKGWMRFPHDPPHPDSFALADAAITAYQSATGDALTEALRERDTMDAMSKTYEATIADLGDRITETEHRAERYEKVVVEVASTTYCENGGGCIAEYNAELARAALATTAGPGGTQ